MKEKFCTLMVLNGYKIIVRTLSRRLHNKLRWHETSEVHTTLILLIVSHRRIYNLCLKWSYCRLAFSANFYSILELVTRIMDFSTPITAKSFREIAASHSCQVRCNAIIEGSNFIIFSSFPSFCYILVVFSHIFSSIVISSKTNCSP